MNANFKINIKNFAVTSSTVNIPIDIKYQLVDNDELIQKFFVDDAIKDSINCILDYDKVKFIPVDNNSKEIINIVYRINLLDQNGNYITPTNLSDLGIDSDDIGFNSNSFKNGFLFLQFYDDYNPQSRNFLTESQIYNFLYPATSFANGSLKSPTQIPLEYIASNPKIIEDGLYTAFHVYDDIDRYKDNNSVFSLYCSAQLFNAKNGKIINLMATNQAPKIDKYPIKQFMKFDLRRTNKGFAYTIDTAFNNNVSITPNSFISGYNDLVINLYQTRVQ